LQLLNKGEWLSCNTGKGRIYAINLFTCVI
jgi:hypothetical protein